MAEIRNPLVIANFWRLLLSPSNEIPIIVHILGRRIDLSLRAGGGFFYWRTQICQQTGHLAKSRRISAWTKSITFGEADQKWNMSKPYRLSSRAQPFSQRWKLDRYPLVAIFCRSLRHLGPVWFLLPLLQQMHNILRLPWIYWMVLRWKREHKSPFFVRSLTGLGFW